jgi:hypothetical protein
MSYTVVVDQLVDDILEHHPEVDIAGVAQKRGTAAAE